MKKVICPYHDECKNQFCFHREPHKICADCFPISPLPAHGQGKNRQRNICFELRPVKKCVPYGRKKF